MSRGDVIQRIREVNPFCDAAPEIFGAKPIEEARQKYPEFFTQENEDRLPVEGEISEKVRT